MDDRRRLVRAFYSDESEARRWVREGFLYVALIHVQLGAVLAGWLPRWSLALGLPVLMARLMIGRHELIHVRKESQVDFFTRLWPVLMMVTPLSAGFRQYRLLHQDHHRYMLTDDDPDAYQIRGSIFQGWFHCFVSPEVTLVRWVRERGLDERLAFEILVRALFFFAVVAIAGRTFLWYWVPLRITYGCALFLFSYVLHRRGAAEGVFRIDLPPVGVTLFCLLFGRAGWEAVCNHDVHHRNANISPLHLVEARALLDG